MASIALERGKVKPNLQYIKYFIALYKVNRWNKPQFMQDAYFILQYRRGSIARTGAAAIERSSSFAHFHYAGQFTGIIDFIINHLSPFYVFL